MIIWGSTGKQKVIDEGQFYCPRCRGAASFSLVRVSRYFTLYFIPLFETSVLGDYVHCQHCQGEYDPQVLQYDPNLVEAALAPWTCSGCGNSNPGEYIECLGCRRWLCNGCRKDNVPDSPHCSNCQAARI